MAVYLLISDMYASMDPNVHIFCSTAFFLAWK